MSSGVRLPRVDGADYLRANPVFSPSLRRQARRRRLVFGAVPIVIAVLIGSLTKVIAPESFEVAASTLKAWIAEHASPAAPAASLPYARSATPARHTVAADASEASNAGTVSATTKPEPRTELAVLSAPATRLEPGVGGILPASRPELSAGTDPASKSAPATSPTPEAKTPPRMQIAATPPAPEPTPGALDAAARADVVEALRRWSAAWSRRDMRAYEAAYTRDFKGRYATHDEWLAERTKRIVPRNSITVSIGEIEVTGTHASVRAEFTQDYATDTLQVRSRRSVSMRLVEGRWLINEESDR